MLKIKDRFRERISLPASLNDFTYAEGEVIDARVVIDNPDISLYCLDDTNRRAVFVEMPPDVDLAQAAFIYQEQFDRAERLIVVPYEYLPKLSGEVQAEVKSPILIHSIGRCGSTLLSRVFNQLSQVTSLSEPDAFSQLVYLREADGSRDAELSQLLQSCVRLICRPITGKQTPIFAIKFRNQCVEMIDLLYQALPHARHLFLYRNALDWVASLYRLTLRHGPPRAFSLDEAQAHWSAYNGRPISLAKMGLKIEADTISFFEYFAVAWLILIERYLEFYEQDIPLFAIRYEDLNANRRQFLTTLFEYCHLPAAAVPQALAAFTRDSQRGTRFARANEKAGNKIVLNKDQKAQIEAILRQHPTVQSPDFILPGTSGL